MAQSALDYTSRLFLVFCHDMCQWLIKLHIDFCKITGKIGAFIFRSNFRHFLSSIFFVDEASCVRAICRFVVVFVVLAVNQSGLAFSLAVTFLESVYPCHRVTGALCMINTATLY